MSVAWQVGLLGAVSSGTTGPLSSVAYPATTVAGQFLTLDVLCKRGNAPSTPSGWTLGASATAGAGADGARSGTVTLYKFYKIATGSEGGTTFSLSFTGGTDNCLWARINGWANATGYWDVAFATGSDTVPATNVTVVFGTNPGITTGDVVVVVSALNDNVATYSGETLTASGITFALTSERADTQIAIGDGMRQVLCEFSVSSGTASGVATYFATASANTANGPCGPAILMRLRELPPAPVAAFSGDTLSGPAPLTVNFTDASTNTPTSWAWDFDNSGSTDSTSQNPSNVYSTPGTYTVKLTATNATGSDDEIKTGYITVTSAGGINLDRRRRAVTAIRCLKEMGIVP
jgi:PKD repeat protein